jgi:AbrB family looped-hinge helix DNA binding protein
MATTSISSRGQVVIPMAVRKGHDWKPGTVLQVVDLGDAVLLRPVSLPRRTTLDELIGCLRFEGPPKTLDEMEAGIREGARQGR